MAVLSVLGGVAIIVGLVAVFLRLFPGSDADRSPEHPGSEENGDVDLDEFRGFDGGGFGGGGHGGGYGGGAP